MCDCNATCDDLASNPGMQIVYISACAVSMLFDSLSFFISAFGVEVGFFATMLLGLGGYGVSLLSLGMLVLLILGVTSRCCAPYCCERMLKTPRPCPPGPCSCRNMVLLDYPMFLALSVQVVVSFLISAIENTSLPLRLFHSTYGEKLEGIKRLEQISLLFSVFMLAIALYCAVQKYRLLHEQLLPRVMDISAPTPTVVGAPVRGALGAAVGTPYRP